MDNDEFERRDSRHLSTYTAHPEASRLGTVTDNVVQTGNDAYLLFGMSPDGLVPLLRCRSVLASEANALPLYYTSS
jgi:hypothetical protein